MLEVDGVTLVSPWRTALRSQEALLDFCAELPDLVADAFVPAALLERAEVELDRWRAEHGSTTSHTDCAPGRCRCAGSSWWTRRSGASRSESPQTRRERLSAAVPAGLWYIARPCHGLAGGWRGR